MAPRYYEKEDARWGYLNQIFPRQAQVVRAIRRWASIYLASGDRASRPFHVYWRPADYEWAWAKEKEILLTEPVSWLLVAHEFAHLIQYRRRYKKRVWHGPYHANLVDELCRDLIRQGLDRP